MQPLSDLKTIKNIPFKYQLRANKIHSNEMIQAGLASPKTPLNGQQFSSSYQIFKLDTVWTNALTCFFFSLLHFIGGYDRFSTQYPDYCLKTKTLPVSSPQSSVETSCTFCATPQHDQVTTLAALDTLRSANGQHCVTLNVLLTAVIRCSFRLIQQYF